jgi:hypothetical protein
MNTASFKRLSIIAVLAILVSLPSLSYFHNVEHPGHTHSEICVSCAVIDGSSKAVNTTLDFANRFFSDLFDWAFQQVIPTVELAEQPKARAPPSFTTAS